MKKQDKKKEPVKLVIRSVSSAIRFISGKTWWLNLSLSCGHTKIIEDVKPMPKTTECYLCTFRSEDKKGRCL